MAWLAKFFHWPPSEIYSLPLREVLAWLREASAIQREISDEMNRRHR